MTLHEFGPRIRIMGPSNSGKSMLAEAIARTQGLGFKVNLVYVGLRSVQNSVGRVRERVARGGHDVPRADLLRRFGLPKAMAFSDRVILLDNSGRRRRFLHACEGGRLRFTTPTLPLWTARMLG
ncbi:hypothetical protein AAC691_15335 [Nguyenibacter vanlangensis]|uniref:Uncharacterized protein n=1 Tax=Nguyenibacter vanlangensis TaxID=1216886 RepID=A0ABZ3D231_9PROT